MTAPDSLEKERDARVRDVIEQCERVAKLHQKMLRNPGRVTDTDSMVVRRLIRTLVAEWV